MSPLPLGIVASSAISEIATGGSIINGSNGYRYHVFNSSGTFVLNQAKTLYYYVQNSGYNGGSGNYYYYFASGGNGGNGGNLGQNFSVFQPGNISVTVGAFGSSSSISGMSTPTFVNGGSSGVGGTVYRQSGTSLMVSPYPGGGSNGQSLSLNSIWQDSAIQSYTPAQAGGGGGGAGGSFTTDYYYTSGYMSGMGGGLRGGGSGGGANAESFYAASGGNGTANAGAGGGGGGGYFYEPYGGFGGAAGGGYGGSGRVVIAYSLT